LSFCVHHRDLLSFPTRRSSDLHERSDFAVPVHAISDHAGSDHEGGESAPHLAPIYADSASAAHDSAPFSIRVVDEMPAVASVVRSEEHTSELQSRGHLVCRLLL